MRRALPCVALFALLLPFCRVGIAQETAAQKPDVPLVQDRTAGRPAETAAKDTKDAKDTKEPDVVYVPTPHDVVLKMLAIAHVEKKDLLYDLGCGDGRIMVMAAKKFGCRAIGFDVDPQRVRETRQNIEKNKVQRLVEVRQEDVFKLDLSPASVVTMYLLPALNVRLIPQLGKLKPGSRIVTHDFDIEGYRPDRAIEITSNEDNVEHRVYLFTTPLKKE
jgi:precorrin-6B methylase 2